MKPLLSLVLVAALWFPAVAVPAASRADLTDAMQVFEQQVALQQERVQAVEHKLQATDLLVEKRIARVLATFTPLADSPASGTRILRAKRDLYDLLKRNLEFLVRERGQRFTACYRPMSQSMREQLAADVTWLNARIEKRIEQGLALAASIPAEKAIVKQHAHWDREYRNPAYDHQRQMLAFARVWRDDVQKDLTGSVDRLQRSGLELERARHYAQRADNRQFVEQLIEQNNAFVAKRREQLLTVVTAANSSPRELGRDAANALLELLASEQANNRTDHAAWIQLKNQRDTERLRLASLQDRLAYSRQTLETRKP